MGLLSHINVSPTENGWSVVKFGEDGRTAVFRYDEMDKMLGWIERNIARPEAPTAIPDTIREGMEENDR